MQIRVLCVGKLKEKSLSALCAEYEKRLSRYVRIEIVEVADEPAPEKLSATLREKVKAAEGARLLQKSRAGAVNIALCLDGAQPDSPTLARQLRDRENSGAGCVQYFIGGSLGLSREVIGACGETLCLSNLTFPHNLARLVLLEQLYRCYKINRGETYHK